MGIRERNLEPSEVVSFLDERVLNRVKIYFDN